MKDSAILDIHASNLRLLQPQIEQIENIAQLQSVIEDAIARKYFRPEEERKLQQWFFEFLKVRKQLWHIIEDIQLFLNDDLTTIEKRQWPFVIIGYCAICLLVRVDFLLVKRLAIHSLVQRKLNEAYLDPSKKNFFNLYFNYRWHYLRRKIVILTQFSLFWLLETSGRIVSELRDRWTPKRVTQTIRDQLANILEPGDILLTKHRGALTNLFLPGFWPHSALYVGAIHQHPELQISDQTHEHWFGTRCVLEALKDGVHFRPPHLIRQ